MPSRHLDPVVRGAAGGVATITLDSPANRNALSAALIEQLLAGAGRGAGATTPYG